MDKQVPDSAGTATALFTGSKTNYGYLGYDSTADLDNLEQGKLTTIMEWAQKAGKGTGFVTTTRVTHATPAALYARTPIREFECDSSVPTMYKEKIADIARQLVENEPGNRLNVILGGGRHMMGCSEFGKSMMTEQEYDKMLASRSQHSNSKCEYSCRKQRRYDPDMYDPEIEENEGNLNGTIETHVEKNGTKPVNRRRPIANFKGKFEKLCYRTDNRNLAEEWLQQKPNDGETSFVLTAEELNSIKANKTKYLLGLFADNHLSYSEVRRKSSTSEPSIVEMTKVAIDVLQEQNKENGFLLMVEGGRIDQAHHQNLAKLALDETVELDKAVQLALASTNPKETLIIVTADHSHAVTINGYAKRGNDILGFANKPNVAPYETLTYANGPGFLLHRADPPENGTNEYNVTDTRYTWVPVQSFSNKTRKMDTYQHQAMFHMEDETHGGEDVAVYATGPGSSLFCGTFEQNYVGIVISYAGCIGPLVRYNAKCNTVKYDEVTLPNISSSQKKCFLVNILPIAAIIWNTKNKFVY